MMMIIIVIIIVVVVVLVAVVLIERTIHCHLPNFPPIALPLGSYPTELFACFFIVFTYTFIHLHTHTHIHTYIQASTAAPPCTIIAWQAKCSPIAYLATIIH